MSARIDDVGNEMTKLKDQTEEPAPTGKGRGRKKGQPSQAMLLENIQKSLDLVVDLMTQMLEIRKKKAEKRNKKKNQENDTN